MQGVLACSLSYKEIYEGGRLSVYCYEIADAMLEARDAKYL